MNLAFNSLHCIQGRLPQGYPPNGDNLSILYIVFFRRRLRQLIKLVEVAFNSLHCIPRSVLHYEVHAHCTNTFNSLHCILGRPLPHEGYNVRDFQFFTLYSWEREPRSRLRVGQHFQFFTLYSEPWEPFTLGKLAPPFNSLHCILHGLK